MARINYPEDFLNQTILFNNMKTKHDNDLAGGAPSPITPFLTQKGIDLEDDKEDTDAAVAQNTLFDKTAKKAEDHTQDRNNLFDPVIDGLKKSIQFLKKFYAGNAKELGRWGVQVDEERIVYPPDFLRLARLFKKVKARHDNLGNDSPLTPFLTQNSIDMAADGEDTEAAKTTHADKEQAKKDAEKYSEGRDKLFDPVFANVRDIGGYLKSLYVSNPKKLGDWGYEVDDSPRDPRFRTAAIEPGGTHTLTGVKLNSQVENTGTVELLLHKGKEVGTEPVALPAEMRFTIKRGWGTLTVQNENPTEAGEIGYMSVSGLH